MSLWAEGEGQRVLDAAKRAAEVLTEAKKISKKKPLYRKMKLLSKELPFLLLTVQRYYKILNNYQKIVKIIQQQASGHFLVILQMQVLILILCALSNRLLARLLSSQRVVSWVDPLRPGQRKSRHSAAPSRWVRPALAGAEHVTAIAHVIV